MASSSSPTSAAFQAEAKAYCTGLFSDLNNEVGVRIGKITHEMTTKEYIIHHALLGQFIVLNNRGKESLLKVLSFNINGNLYESDQNSVVSKADIQYLKGTKNHVVTVLTAYYKKGKNEGIVELTSTTKTANLQGPHKQSSPKSAEKAARSAAYRLQIEEDSNGSSSSSPFSPSSDDT